MCCHGAPAHSVGADSCSGRSRALLAREIGADLDRPPLKLIACGTQDLAPCGHRRPPPAIKRRRIRECGVRERGEGNDLLRPRRVGVVGCPPISVPGTGDE